MHVPRFYVEHFNGLSYVHPQKIFTVEGTILTKRSFQAYTRNHGVVIKHYHVDNGRFADQRFLFAIEKE